MTHDIDNGTAFYGRMPAWHRLGTVIPEGVGTMEALKLAQADYEVRSTPVQAALELGDGEQLLDVVTHKVNWRINPHTGEPQALGVVGTNYEVLQNADAFGFLDTLLEWSADPIIVETAGVLNEGRRVFVTCRLPQDILLGEMEDKLAMNVALLNSHDGGGAFKGLITPTRIVCANTEAVALRNARRKFSIQHRVGLGGNIAKARDMLGFTLAYTDKMLPVFDAMARAEITDAKWTNILEQVIVPDPKGDSKAAQSQADAKRDEIDALYRGEANASINGTVWGAFNAWTEYLDHFRPTRDEDGASRDANVIQGYWSKPKDEVFAALAKRKEVKLSDANTSVVQEIEQWLEANTPAPQEEEVVAAA